MILYAPTYRVRRRTKWFPFPDMDFEHLNKWLEEQNVVLALRTHPNEKPSFRDVLRLSPRCVLAGSDIEPDVTRLLAHCAGVVTDYSSIYLEGLLLDLPVVYLPYDLQEYERGQPVPYDTVTPGPKPETFQAFLSSLEEMLSGAPAYASERERVRGMYFSDMQGKAIQRVTQLLENLVFAK
jgi:CDP-glycerol glycerophosphotransferase